MMMPGQVHDGMCYSDCGIAGGFPHPVTAPGCQAYERTFVTDLSSVIKQAQGMRDAPDPYEEAQRAKLSIRGGVLPQLEVWWINYAKERAHACAEKAAAYGSVDLDIMGDVAARMTPALGENTSLRQQMAIAQYALGKVSRIFSALARGEQPSKDSWDDLATYATMGVFVQQFGRWF